MSEPFLSEIRLMSFNFAPKGWALCNGQFMPINQNQALFSLLGTTYGGDGRVTFALPDLRSRVPIHFGTGFGGSNHTLGERGGQEAHTLTISELPAHIHQMRGDGTTAAASNAIVAAAGNALGQTTGVASQGSGFAANIYSTNAATGALAPQSVGNTGGSQPHENRQPFLVLSYCIALQGIFPSQT
jgi:microcystin-dependent protein